MKLRATRSGTWPAWCHWAEGDVHEIKVEKGAEVPAFLVEVKAPAKKAKKSAESEG